MQSSIWLKVTLKNGTKLHQSVFFMSQHLQLDKSSIYIGYSKKNSRSLATWLLILLWTRWKSSWWRAEEPSNWGSITLLLSVDHVAELSGLKVGLLGLVNLICQTWSSLVESEFFFVSGLVCPPTDFWLMHVELAWCFLWWALMMGLTCNPACCFQFGQTWQMPPPPDGQKEKDVWILTLSKLLEYFSYLLCCQVLTDSQELLQSAIW